MAFAASRLAQASLPARLRRLALPAVLATAAPALLMAGFIGASPVQAAEAAKPEAPKAPDPAKVVRPELAKIINGARDLLAKENYKDALATLQPADAMPNQTPYEHFLVVRLKAIALVGVGDMTQADPLQEEVVANPEVNAEDRLTLERMMAQRWYGKAPHTQSVKWGRRYFADGGKDDVVHTMIIQSFFQASDWANTVESSKIAIAAAEAEGKAPSEARLQMLSAAYDKLKDDGGHVAVLERLVQLYPKPVYWQNLLANIERKPGFEDYVVLDVYRLRIETGTISDADDFVDYAKMAQRAGYPAEAKRALDAGVSSGALAPGKEPAEYAALRAKVEKQAGEDRALLGQGETRAEAAKDGNPLFGVGLNYVSHERFDSGLPLMVRALERGGLKRPSLARLQLGEAYVRAGRKDDAIKVLATVNGEDGSGDLARLWLLYLKDRK